MFSELSGHSGREIWASKSAGAKGDVSKIYGFVHPRAKAFPALQRLIMIQTD